MRPTKMGAMRGQRGRPWNPVARCIPKQLPLVVCVAMVVFYLLLMHMIFSRLESEILLKHAEEMRHLSMTSTATNGTGTNTNKMNMTNNGAESGSEGPRDFPPVMVGLSKISGMDMVRDGMAHLERATSGLHAIFPAFSDTRSVSEFAMQLDILALELLKGDAVPSVLKRAEDLWIQYEPAALSPRVRQIQTQQAEEKQQKRTRATSPELLTGHDACQQMLRQYPVDIVAVLESIIGFRALITPRASHSEVQTWKQREAPWLALLQSALAVCSDADWVSLLIPDDNAEKQIGEEKAPTAALTHARSLSALGETLALLDLLRGQTTTATPESRLHDSVVEPLLQRLYLSGVHDPDGSSAIQTTAPSCPAASAGVLGAVLTLPTLDDFNSTVYGVFDEGTVHFMEYVLHEWVRCVTSTGASAQASSRGTDHSVAAHCDALGDAYERMVSGIVKHMIRTFSSRNAATRNTKMATENTADENSNGDSSHHHINPNNRSKASGHDDMTHGSRQETTDATAHMRSLLKDNVTVLGMLFDPHYQEHDEARWLPIVYRSTCGVPAVLGFGVHAGVHRRARRSTDVTLSEADVLVAAESLLSTCMRLRAVRADLPPVVGIDASSTAQDAPDHPSMNGGGVGGAVLFAGPAAHRATAKGVVADTQAFRSTLLRGCYMLYLATEDEMYGHMARETLGAPVHDVVPGIAAAGRASSSEVVLSAVAPRDSFNGMHMDNRYPQSELEAYLSDYMAQQRYFGLLFMSMECVVYKRKNRGLCPLLQGSFLTSHGHRVATLDHRFPS